MLISEKQIIAINKWQIEKYSPREMIGVKGPGLLSLCLNKPYQTAFGEEIYKSTIEKIVAVYTSLLRNHVFYNANKRTALAALLVMLVNNNISIDKSNDELIDLSLSYVNHELSDEQVLKIILDSLI